MAVPTGGAVVYGGLHTDGVYAGYRTSICQFTALHFADVYVSDNCVNSPPRVQIFEMQTDSTGAPQDCSGSANLGCFISECQSGNWENSLCTRVDSSLRPSRATTTTVVDLSNGNTAVSGTYTLANLLNPTGIDC